MTTTPPVALVTGAARRIGAAVARHLHAHGYMLTLHYRHSREQVEALAAELDASRPGSICVLEAELTRLECLPALVGRTLERFGRLDAVVNNASAFYPTPLDAATPAQWDELMACNARAPFFLVKAAAPFLKASAGAVVNLADLYAHTPLRGHSIYSISKAALVMATHALALELAPDVRVNAIAPGPIETPLIDGLSQDWKSAKARELPLGRFGKPHEIAPTAVLLASDPGGNLYVGQTLGPNSGDVMP